MASVCKECKPVTVYTLDYPPLWYAARNGHAQCVNVLIKAGANVNKQIEHRGAPLIEAAWKGSEECVKLLLEAGANVNIANQHERTAVHNTAIKGHYNCLKLLIQAGANVNHPNSLTGATPLMFAGQCGNLNCVQELIKSGAEVDAMNHYGGTTLMKAARGENDTCVDCVEFLIKAGADVNKRNVYAKTALKHAAEEGNLECLTLLLNAGANVNSVDALGYTAVHFAARNGHPVIVQQLIDAGADVNKTNKVPGQTPLMEGACQNNPECVNILIKGRANVNMVDNDAKTVLIHAAEKGNLECLTLLLNAGANVNSVDALGYTAVHYATRNRHHVILQKLIDARADVNKANRVLDHTPLMEAISQINQEIVKWLIKAGVDAKTALIQAAERWNTECLLKGADMNNTNAIGQTSLQKAMEEDKLTCVTLLIQARADVNQVDKFGNTALTTAAILGNLQCVTMLLKSGAHVNKSMFGSNSVQLYISDVRPLQKDVAMLLYAAGEEVIECTSYPIRWRFHPTSWTFHPKVLRFKKIKLQLKHICREAIRNHLLTIDPCQNLFVRVPRLGLPFALVRYLLFNMSLTPPTHGNVEVSDDVLKKLFNKFEELSVDDRGWVGLRIVQPPSDMWWSSIVVLARPINQ